MAHKVTLTLPCNCTHPTDHGELPVYEVQTGVKSFADAVREEKQRPVAQRRKGGNRRK